MKKIITINPFFIFMLISIFFVAGCGGNGGNGNKDADTETVPDQPLEEVGEQPLEEPEEITQDQQDQEGEQIEDTITEELTSCPPNNPPNDIYIEVDGKVLPLDGQTSVEGMLVAAISPMDALLNPTPQHLMEDTVSSDGSFNFHCLDVGEVHLGLVVLADDSGSSNNWYPTGTGIKAWGTPPVKEDVHDATVFGITNSLAHQIESLTGMNFDQTGVVIGLVIDGTTRQPIDGATIERSGPGDPLNIAYLNSTLSGLESDGNTSTSGAFVIVVTQQIGLTNITANASGYTFDVHQVATKAGFIYFLVIVGTPQ